MWQNISSDHSISQRFNFDECEAIFKNPLPLYHSVIAAVLVTENGYLETNYMVSFFE
jgi:hypothetical protein